MFVPLNFLVITSQIVGSTESWWNKRPSNTQLPAYCMMWQKPAFHLEAYLPSTLNPARCAITKKLPIFQRTLKTKARLEFGLQMKPFMGIQLQLPSDWKLRLNFWEGRLDGSYSLQDNQPLLGFPIFPVQYQVQNPNLTLFERVSKDWDNFFPYQEEGEKAAYWENHMLPCLERMDQTYQAYKAQSSEAENNSHLPNNADEMTITDLENLVANSALAGVAFQSFVFPCILAQSIHKALKRRPNPEDFVAHQETLGSLIPKPWIEFFQYSSQQPLLLATTDEALKTIWLSSASDLLETIALFPEESQENQTNQAIITQALLWLSYLKLHLPTLNNLAALENHFDEENNALNSLKKNLGQRLINVAKGFSEVEDNLISNPLANLANAEEVTNSETANLDNFAWFMSKSFAALAAPPHFFATVHQAAREQSFALTVNHAKGYACFSAFLKTQVQLSQKKFFFEMLKFLEFGQGYLNAVRAEISKGESNLEDLKALVTEGTLSLKQHLDENLWEQLRTILFTPNAADIEPLLKVKPFNNREQSAWRLFKIQWEEMLELQSFLLGKLPSKKIEPTALEVAVIASQYGQAFAYSPNFSNAAAAYENFKTRLEAATQIELDISQNHLFKKAFIQAFKRKKRKLLQSVTQSIVKVESRIIKPEAEGARLEKTDFLGAAIHFFNTLGRTYRAGKFIYEKSKNIKSDFSESFSSPLNCEQKLELFSNIARNSIEVGKAVEIFRGQYAPQVKEAASNLFEGKPSASWQPRQVAVEELKKTATEFYADFGAATKFVANKLFSKSESHPENVENCTDLIAS